MPGPKPEFGAPYQMRGFSSTPSHALVDPPLLVGYLPIITGQILPRGFKPKAARGPQGQRLNLPAFRHRLCRAISLGDGGCGRRDKSHWRSRQSRHGRGSRRFMLKLKKIFV